MDTPERSGTVPYESRTLFDRLQRFALHQHWSMPVRYLAATLIVIVSTLIRFKIPVLGLPYLLYIPFLMLISFVLGLGPGLYATVLAALSAAYLLLPPSFSFELTAENWTGNALFIVVSFSIVAVCAVLRHSLIHLQGFADTLERRVETRTRERDQIWQVSPDMVCTANRSGHLIEFNQAWSKVLGWSEEELRSLSIWERIHPDDIENTSHVLASLKEGENVFRFENRCARQDGQYGWLSWNAVVRDNVLYATVRDVTAEKEQAEALRNAEELLRHSQKMEAVGQLTGGIAHDFNNLLTSITGSLEMIQMRLAQGRLDAIKRYVQAAQTASHRAASLTHRLLAFSRRQTLDPSPTQANGLIEGMHELIERTAGPHICVETVLARDLWPTLCDPNQLENALLNLFINARDAMPNGGQLTIRTSNMRIDQSLAKHYDMAVGEYVAISVTDNGVGMTPDIVARAFDPFFTTKPIGMGTGLGLSMIYGFAKQSGGQARIESEAGQGTTIWLYLPRCENERQGEHLQPQLLSAPRSGTGETILVVDDEPMVRALIVETLAELGYQMIEAEDGPSGLQILQSGRPIDLVISDVGMPGGMNGRQMADAARQTRPDLKVLFITGYAENAAVGNGNLEPGMHVMTKPFAMEMLAYRVKTLTSQT
ncbi:PAS domain S-box-containing protein [Pseudomonas duriflava]|uniref:histidine kinase n=1 Tax=Pseudomonas duriflava TaxID=459528 RepID=A0A562QHB8_9PSED|nr:ATP-binding protein [Pseudomonas duriflava]TWI55590.1 PAS domain S-box-containing protein [Pseudomonas duriflava]